MSSLILLQIHSTIVRSQFPLSCTFTQSKLFWLKLRTPAKAKFEFHEKVRKVNWSSHLKKRELKLFRFRSRFCRFVQPFGVMLYLLFGWHYSGGSENLKFCHIELNNKDQRQSFGDGKGFLMSFPLHNLELWRTMESSSLLVFVYNKMKFQKFQNFLFYAHWSIKSEAKEP